MRVNLQDKNQVTSLARNVAISLRTRMILLPWVVYVCVVIVHAGIDLMTIISGLLLFITVYGVVALQNDLSDVDTDRLNRRKDIPLSQGMLTEAQVVITMLILSIIATLTALTIGYFALVWVGVYIGLGYLYSGPANIKSRGISAALLLGFCYGAMPWIIGAIATNQLDNPSIAVFAFISFVYSSGVIVLKDFKDKEGDAATGKRTLLIRRGAKFTRNYYLAMTSGSYILLGLYCYLITQNFAFTCVYLLVGMLNYFLLGHGSIELVPASRGLRGNWSRALFFISALSLYCLVSTGFMYKYLF